MHIIAEINAAACRHRPHQDTVPKDAAGTPNSYSVMHSLGTAHKATAGIDIVLPTHNRSHLLARALASVEKSREYADADVHLIVVANACRDETAQTVEEFREAFGGQLTLVVRNEPGKSAALNAGIAAGSHPIVGLFDDDEELYEDWIDVALRVLEDPSLDFVGGPCVGNWQLPKPDWYSGHYPAIVGEIGLSTPEHQFTADGPSMLMGGNGVIRRSLLNEVGGYRSDLGPVGTKHMTGEDRDMFNRLIDAGAIGRFLPQLKILHHVPAERISKSYHRRWCLRDGQAHAQLDSARPEQVPRLFGLPRYRIGGAMYAALALVRSMITGSPAEHFDAELSLWHTAGFVSGAWSNRGGPWRKRR